MSDSMSPQSMKIGTPMIAVVATDGTESGAHAVSVAANLARGVPGSELHVIHVIMDTQAAAPGGPMFPSMTELIESGRKLLEGVDAEAQKTFSGRIVGHLAIGEPWREIVQLATNLRADVIVVGTADHTGLRRMILGSVAARVVRKAQCPVLVARKKDYHSRAVAEIEPPCEECLAVQRETKRAQLWCKRHSERHVHGRTHYEGPPSFGMGSMLVRP